MVHEARRQARCITATKHRKLCFRVVAWEYRVLGEHPRISLRLVAGYRSPSGVSCTRAANDRAAIALVADCF